MDKIIPVIAIFDIGKTNKKLFLFDEQYKMVHEENTRLIETVDEDGDPCEDLAALTNWVRETFARVVTLPQFNIKAVNFSAYGASFVHIMVEGSPLLPLYNYLKPFPQELADSFYKAYGSPEQLALQTASPASGHLNSGLQLYRLKKQKREIFKTIRKSLHLPQYLSYLITNQEFSDITSIGCHTYLWNFEEDHYHDWVYAEGIDKKLAPLLKGDEGFKVSYEDRTLMAGIGLHDSSAALIPYLLNFTEPFVLISTGTWCISLNPFNNSPLTTDETKADCLCYLSYKGAPVKANRLFAGYEHEVQTKRIASSFGLENDFYKTISFDEACIARLEALPPAETVAETGFEYFEPELYDNEVEAYHKLMLNIMKKQLVSTGMVLKNTRVSRIFVDGGFSRNPIFMNLLAGAMKGVEVFAASMAQATAMGAALALHHKWNTQGLPANMIELKFYSAIVDLQALNG